MNRPVWGVYICTQTVLRIVHIGQNLVRDVGEFNMNTERNSFWNVKIILICSKYHFNLSVKIYLCFSIYLDLKSRKQHYVYFSILNCENSPLMIFRCKICVWEDFWISWPLPNGFECLWKLFYCSGKIVDGLEFKIPTQLEFQLLQLCFDLLELLWCTKTILLLVLVQDTIGVKLQLFLLTTCIFKIFKIYTLILQGLRSKVKVLLFV